MTSFFNDSICPKCRELYPDNESIWKPIVGITGSALSRRNNARICTLCAKAEALSDYTRGIIDDKMARVSIETDYQEARRLPPGGRWGSAYQFATGVNLFGEVVVHP